MSPSSRPPLTSRIRASFEGKRSKSEVTSPTLGNGFPTQDPESLRFAIDQAINSETFQNAIAANLARLVKPSIKTALDTIQPVVETVYAHEILLRQTNKSVENILLRLENGPDERKRRFSESDDGWEDGAPNDHTTSRPVAPASADHIKQLLEEHHARTTEQISSLSSAIKAGGNSSSEIVDGMAALQADMGLVKQSIRSLESMSEQSHTTDAVMQAQLDQLKADLGSVMDAVGSDLGGHVKAMNEHVARQDTSLLSTHTTKLDMIATDVAALKGHSETLAKIEALSNDLAALKAAVESGIASSQEHFSELGSQVSTVLRTVEGHGSTLTGIKEANVHPDILAALQKSNESHASHAAALGEIKERAIGSGSQVGPAPVAASSRSESGDAHTDLAAHIEALKSSVEAGLASNNEHLTGFGAKIDNVLHTVEELKAGDQHLAILAAVQKSNDYHASHTEALEGVRSLNTAPLATDNSNLDALHAQMGSIATTLHSHTSALDDLKSTYTASLPATAAPTEVKNIQAIESNLESIKETLEVHTSILNELKEDVSAEIFTSLHNITELQTNSTAVLADIKEADVSDEILTALHSSNESHASHAVALKDIHDGVKTSNDAHAIHAASLDEIKALRPGPSEAIPATIVAPSGPADISALESQIGSIATTLEAQNSTLSAIKTGTDASTESHAAHATALAEIRDATAASNTFHDSHMARLSEIKEATASSNDSHLAHATTLRDIKDAATASNDFHNAHTSTLAEIRDATAASNDSHSSHAATLADIRDATASSNDFHNAHASALAEIKDATAASNEAHASHTATLAELKSTDRAAVPKADHEPANNDALQTHLNIIITTLDTQSTSISEIKAATATNPEVLANVKESHALLTSHTTTLDSIKQGTAHNEEILTHVTSLKSTVEDSKTGIDSHGAILEDLHASTRDLHTSTTDSHSSITTAISSLALGGAAGAGAGMLTSEHSSSSSDEILDEVKAVRAIVEKNATSVTSVDENITSLKAQIEINHTTVTTAITTLNDELKAEMDASSTEVATAITALSEDVRKIDILPLTSAVDNSRGDVKSLSTLIDGMGQHIVDLRGDGVHLNEKGAGQLKDQIVAGQGLVTPIPEGAWFKKAVPRLGDEGERSPLVVREREAEEEEEEDGRVEPMSPIQELEEEDLTHHELTAGKGVHERAIGEEPIHHETGHEEVVHEHPGHENASLECPISAVHGEHIHDEEVSKEREQEEMPAHRETLVHEPVPVEEEALHSPAEAEHEETEEPIHSHSAIHDDAAPVSRDEHEHEAVVGAHGADEEGKVVDMDEAAEERHSHPAHELVDEEHAAVVPPASHERHTADEEEQDEQKEHGEKAVEHDAEPATHIEHDAMSSNPEATGKPHPILSFAPGKQPEEDGDDGEAESASTSAITSPMSPDFEEGPGTPTGTGSGGGKKGKKGKKEKGGKKGKKDKNVPFVFEPDEGEGEGEAAD